VGLDDQHALDGQPAADRTGDRGDALRPPTPLLATPFARAGLRGPGGPERRRPTQQ
jgi:hypothetical protein